MILDKETAFIFDKDVTTTPDVIANGNGGNAYSNSFLLRSLPLLSPRPP